jgi:hypothetical protein
MKLTTKVILLKSEDEQHKLKTNISLTKSVASSSSFNISRSMAGQGKSFCNGEFVK